MRRKSNPDKQLADLTGRVEKLEKSLLALQVFIRDLTCATGNIALDVEDLFDDSSEE